MSNPQDILQRLRTQENVVRGVIREPGACVKHEDGHFSLTKLGLTRFNKESRKLNILASEALRRGFTREEVFSIERR